MKTSIRNGALSVLASPCKSARKGAAQAVAGIAALDLPNNRWHEVITSLVYNAQGDNIIYKMSALQALSYICEELDKNVLSQEEVDSILSAVVSSFSSDDNVKEVAMTALESIIPFCEKNLKIEKEKTLLLGKIVENCKSGAENIRLKAMKCLLGVTKYFYDYIDDDGLELIGDATTKEIKKNRNDDMGILAVEVWSSLCDEEIIRLKENSPTSPCMNYIKRAFHVLLPLMLNALEKTSEDIDTNWDVPLAAMCCISLMAEIIKDDILTLVLSYVEHCFTFGEWQKTKAGITAFVAITKGPSKEKINNYILKALGSFLGLLESKQPQVRESVAWAFSKFTKTNVEVFTDQGIFIQTITTFTTSLKDIPKVSNHICFAMSNLATQLPNIQLKSHEFLTVLRSLWDNAFRADAFGETICLARSSFIALSSLGLNVPLNCVTSLEEMSKLVIDSFARTLNKTFPIPARVNEFQEYFCDALYPILMKIGPKMDAKLIETVVDLILESFKYRSIVYDEGLRALNGLIIGTKKAFQPYVNKFGPYLVHSLKSIDDPVLCRVAIGCVSDLARALEERIANYLVDLTPLLLKILENPEAEYRLKPLVISALGDLAYFSTTQFNVYLKSFLETLKSAARLSLKLLEDVSFGFEYRKIQSLLNTFISLKNL